MPIKGNFCVLKLPKLLQRTGNTLRRRNW